MRLHVEGDGRVRVFTAMQAMGQGIETSYVQILAETLELDPDRIVIVQGDSDIAQGIGQHGQPLALHRRLGDADRVEAGDREGPRTRRRGAGGARRRTSSTATAASRSPAPTSASIWPSWRSSSPSGASRSRPCRRSAARRGRTAATSAKSRSIPRPAHVEIVRYTTVDDVGRVINPLIVAGQVHGGIAQAVGQALHGGGGLRRATASW